MGLCLGLLVRFARAHPFEGEVVAGVGVGEDGGDLSDSRFGHAVDDHGAAHAAVADMVGDDPSVPAAIGRPNHRSLLFFWT